MTRRSRLDSVLFVRIESDLLARLDAVMERSGFRSSRAVYVRELIRRDVDGTEPGTLHPDAARRVGRSIKKAASLIDSAAGELRKCKGDLTGGS